MGDRLGLCASGVLGAFEKTDAVPMLVQQSARELTLSGRTAEEAVALLKDCIRPQERQEPTEEPEGGE